LYQCNEIRQQGRGASPPEQCRKTCGIASHMYAAEAAWRASLAGVSLADIVAGLPRGVARRTQRLLARA
jgi:DNA-binding IscR family transcriptional regulator